jgi:hypothetical protein
MQVRSKSCVGKLHNTRLKLQLIVCRYNYQPLGHKISPNAVAFGVESLQLQVAVLRTYLLPENA